MVSHRPFGIKPGMARADFLASTLEERADDTGDPWCVRPNSQTWSQWLTCTTPLDISYDEPES
jgi:hypothetical protein